MEAERERKDRKQWVKGTQHCSVCPKGLHCAGGGAAM